MNTNTFTVLQSLPEDQVELMHQVVDTNRALFELLNGSVYLSEEQAAQRLGVSKNTFRKWVDAGKFRQFKIEGRNQYRASYLDEDFEKHFLVQAYLEPSVRPAHRPARRTTRLAERAL
ncbi:hypothetical protein GCM10027275_25190 [Rhabdobacter roseus]|uniref:Excisionase family DNA binding protein n=1 Tax=Rhabdobacter roseus TaxID=1655419 RepID=A0A840TWZ4_9BACT|nr:helix-turn-helix domain-containing protein [Rhabdobacter roseus]MBB5284460.1 excisionase family DNA binding protein [Rhabdobacter roseus]